MSRLRGNLPVYLQRCFNISRRTFERWCARGDVPGAYRTRGGHWRVRNPAWATVKSRLFHRSITRRDKVWRAIIDCPFNPSNVYPSAQDLARDRAETKFSMAAYGGCTERDVWDVNLDERDPEKCRFLNGPPRRHPRALEAMNDPLFALKFAGYEMRLNGEEVTRASLARALGVCVSTLYRRYGRREIWKVCQEQPLYVVESLGKKTPTKVRSDKD